MEPSDSAVAQISGISEPQQPSMSFFLVEPTLSASKEPAERATVREEEITFAVPEAVLLMMVSEDPQLEEEEPLEASPSKRMSPQPMRACNG
jgi:hypothetical protein